MAVKGEAAARRTPRSRRPLQTLPDRGPRPRASCRAPLLADTRQLSEGEGAASFICVPVVPEPSLATDRAALAALLLAYPSTSAAPQG